MTHHRNKYDSIIPWLYANNKEKLLSLEFRNSIPRSTVSEWKANGYSNYYGAEYRVTMNSAIDRETLLLEYKNLKRTVDGLIRIWLSMYSILIPLLHNDKKLQHWLVEHAQQLMQVVNKKTALKLMGFNGQSFHYRVRQLIACTGSQIGQCIKRNSQQLTFNEIEVIRKLFADKDKSWWSMSSLYYEALNNGTLRIHLSTFYKYVKLLGLTRKSTKPKDYKKGIRATAPNQFLHIDTTYYTLPETGNKAAIVFASDNFSRYIMGSLVAERNSSINVHDVIKQTVDTIRKLHPEYNKVTKLVSDGGPENNNKLVDQFIETIDIPPLEKLIAKKDIQFSNSPIEAVNKIFKRYLRTKKPQTYQELKVVTDEFVEAYNTIRPHGSLNGLTPIEAYQNKQANDYSRAIQQARVERIEINKAKTCGIC